MYDISIKNMRDNSVAPFMGKMNNPVYVANTSTAYCQVKKGICYRGNVSGSSNDMLYFYLENPKGSRMNFYILKTIVASMSEQHMKVSSYHGIKPQKWNSVRAGKIVNLNSCIQNRYGCALLCSSQTGSVSNQEPDYVYTLDSYGTYEDVSGGGLLLTPGNSYIVVMDELEKKENIIGSCSFTWWEEIQNREN